MASWIMQNFPQIAEIITQLLPKDYLLYSTDLSKFTFTDETNYSLPTIKVGQSFAKGSVADQVIKNKRPVAIEIDPNVYGIALKVINLPIFDDENPQQVVGTIGLGIRRNNTFKLRTITDNYQIGLEEISTIIQAITIYINEINASAKILHDQMFSVQETVTKISQILNDITNVAEQTKILGINAVIEAARAGEQGQGFGVLAKEIHKLSESSKNTADQIMNLAKVIEYNVTLGYQSSEAILIAVDRQTTMMEELSYSVEELAGSLQELHNIAYII